MKDVDLQEILNLIIEKQRIWENRVYRLKLKNDTDQSYDEAVRKNSYYKQLITDFTGMAVRHQTIPASFLKHLKEEYETRGLLYAVKLYRDVFLKPLIECKHIIEDCAKKEGWQKPQ